MILQTKSLDDVVTRPAIISEALFEDLQGIEEK